MSIQEATYIGANIMSIQEATYIGGKYYVNTGGYICRGQILCQHR